jgi:signal transduction histidine kinase
LRVLPGRNAVPVSEITKAHGGEARVESSEPDGATFTVVIPRSI